MTALRLSGAYQFGEDMFRFFRWVDDVIDSVEIDQHEKLYFIKSISFLINSSESLLPTENNFEFITDKRFTPAVRGYANWALRGYERELVSRNSSGDELSRVKINDIRTRTIIPYLAIIKEVFLPRIVIEGREMKDLIRAMRFVIESGDIRDIEQDYKAGIVKFTPKELELIEFDPQKESVLSTAAYKSDLLRRTILHTTVFEFKHPSVILSSLIALAKVGSESIGFYSKRNPFQIRARRDNIDIYRDRMAFLSGLFSDMSRKHNESVSLIDRMVGLPGPFVFALSVILLKTHITKDGGPLFYYAADAQGGFNMKFRTMVQGAEKHYYEEKRVMSEKTTEDPRITSIGKTIRKYSSDEIPQWLQLYLGQLRLFGPRVILERELDVIDDISLRRKYETLRREVGKPGLVSGYSAVARGSTVEKRIKAEIAFMENPSLLGRIYTSLKTILNFLNKKGAC